MKLVCLAVLCGAMIAGIAPLAQAQGRPQDAATIARRNAIEKELESIAIIERKVMVPMRACKRISTGPKTSQKSIPSSLVALLTTSTTGMWS
jgi:hypothetical protein